MIIQQQFLSENLLAINNHKNTTIHKPVFLDLSKLEITKVRIYKFWYDFVELKYGEKAKLCYMDTDSVIVYIKTEDNLQTLEKI